MSDEEDILSIAIQRVGSVLHGKYRLDAVVGIGGMAVVYAATHRNQKQFAIKMLRPEFAVRSEFRARFLREGYAANSVKHPGVVAVLDDDVDETGTAFLVLELLHGADVEWLRSRCGGKLPVQLALAVAHEVLSVLEVAHAQAVVHRDLKPANFFILESGQLKVLDFGIARMREVSSNISSTRTGALLGTPAFMAPEQASAQSGAVDARSDIWALGASLFTLLSGQFVHEAESTPQTLIRAATTQARSLGSVAPDAPLSVVELVDRALGFEPAARWQSASAMREAVARAHHELFGALTLEPLRACVVGCEAPRYVHASGGRISSSVASALGKSETTADTPNAARAEGAPLASTASPVAVLREDRSARVLRRSALLVGVPALLGALALGYALTTPPPPSAVSMQLKPSVSVAPTAVPVALPSNVAPSAGAAPTPTLEPVKALPLARPRTLAGPKATLAKLALDPVSPVKAASERASPAATAAPVALAPVNPLELKLQ